MLDKLWALPPDMAEEVLRSLYVQTEQQAALYSVTNESKDAYAVVQGVAVIPIDLPITRGDTVSSWSGRRLSIGQDSIRKSLMAAYADTAVKSILLSINSPGGVVHGTKELADFIAQSPKPIASYVDGLCASAAFWLAAATGRIFAPQTASVGSIGVIQTHIDYSSLYESIGIKITHITAGIYKATGSAYKPLSEEDATYLQKHVANIHAIFKTDVKNALGLSLADALWGEAQLFVASEAEPLGIVTAIVQDQNHAITMLSKEAKENVMDKVTLAANHPDLLAEIQAEAVQDMTAKAKDEQDALLAVVKACVGDEAMASVDAALKQCSEASLTPAQIMVLAPSLVTAKSASVKEDSEATAKSAILTGLQNASPEALSANPKNVQTPQSGKSALVSDAENRAAQVQNKG